MTSITTPSPLGSGMSTSFSADSGPLSSTIWIARMRPHPTRATWHGYDMSATAVNERLAALTAAGTSVWLDQLSRGVLESGELARMVAEDSLRGVTSNPAIFEKSILGSADYDAELKALADEGKTAREIYRSMALHDVQAACDIAARRSTTQTGGVDGYVSWEVAPRLAHDTEGTLEQGRMYWDLVDRPNLMIKIPATDAGHPGDRGGAVRRPQHQRHAALQRRRLRARDGGLHPRDGAPAGGGQAARPPLGRLVLRLARRHRGRQAPRGARATRSCRARAGLANARAAYQAFQRIFEGERFAALREAGCPVQRPLWASTGVKNPAYSPTLYVYGLVAPDTVNTMPLPVLEAARPRARSPARRAREDPSADLEALAAAGIDLDDVTDQLLREGIDAFMVPMKKLLDGIETKRAEITA